MQEFIPFIHKIIEKEEQMPLFAEIMDEPEIEEEIEEERVAIIEIL